MSEHSLSPRQWALLLELVRHVGPFLGLTLGQIKSLERIYSSSIRRQSVLVEPNDSTGALSELRQPELLSATASSLYIVNIHGLIRFYKELETCRGTTRHVDIERLGIAVQRVFTATKYPLVDLSVPVPKLGPRKSVEIGRAERVGRSLREAAG